MVCKKICAGFISKIIQEGNICQLTILIILLGKNLRLEPRKEKGKEKIKIFM